MPTTLTTDAVEKSSFIITAAFTDSAGNAVTPKTLTWTLTDLAGTVINEREDVVVTTPASTETIVLSGDDLEITGASNTRLLTIEATYDSAEYGNDLTLKDSVQFDVVNLAAVS